MLSQFARALSAETAFDVLAVAKRLKSQGKDVIELQIGDSPFASTHHALDAGIKAIQGQHTHYCASQGLPSFREAVAHNYFREFGVPLTADNVVVGAYGAGFAAVQNDKETDHGYEKTYKQNGNLVHEQWDAQTKYGEYGLILGDRFAVKLSGNADSIDQLKSAVGSINLAGLEALKDVGVKKG